jgi:NAD(P)-dependent dehydrogenase (short-subunit alcohol dehydrogenase family)
MKKNVIITGGSSGLGNFIGTKLKKENNNVINISRSLSKNLSTYKCDLSNYSDLTKVLKDIKKKIPKIDTLIFCAGKSSFKTNKTNDKWMQSLNDNLLSVVFTLTIFEKIFKLRNINIIIFSSIAAKKIIWDAPIEYSVSKNALNFYGKIIAKKYASKNVKVNIISPGNILIKNNNWYKRLKKDKYKTLKYIRKNVPSNNFCYPDTLYELIRIILSKKSNFLGSNIVVDGGQSI